MDPESIVLAVLQGLFEWWPISSSGVVLLVSMFYGLNASTGYSIGLALHLGSGLSIIYLLRDRVRELLSKTFSFRLDSYIKGYYTGLASSVIVGAPLYFLFKSLSAIYGVYALLIVSIGLFTTSFFLLKSRGGVRRDVGLLDWVITGVLQGVAALPGFSRSGLTIGYLSIRRYDPEVSVEASLLLGAPILVGAGVYNTAVLIGYYSLPEFIADLIVVFVISVLSARILMEAARRLRFYRFTLLFAVLVLAGAVIQLIASIF